MSKGKEYSFDLPAFHPGKPYTVAGGRSTLGGALQLTILVDSVYVCPECGRRFTATAVMSCGYDEKDTDFCPRFWGFNPLPFFVKICPHCGYAGRNKLFQEAEAEVQDEGKGESLPREPEMPAWRKYELLAEQQERRGAIPFQLGEIYHRAAWCCRTVRRNRQLEQKFLRRACSLFEEALRAKEGVPEKIRPAITYLVGELHRHTGDPKSALSWFGKVPSLVGDDEELKWLLELTEKQKKVAEKELETSKA